MAIYDQLILYQAVASGQSLVVEVSDNLGWGTSPSTAQQNKITTALNHIQKVVCRKHPWRALDREDSSYITVKDQVSYELDPQIKTITNARLIDDTAYVLDNGDSGWTAGSNITLTHDTTFRKEGTGSIKLVTSGDPTGVAAYSENKLLAITAFATVNTNQTTVTSASHGLSNGDVVTIAGSTSYNETFRISAKTTNTFVIDKTFVADDATGTWYKGNISGGDLSAVKNGVIGCWVYSSVALTVGQLQITVAEDANGAQTNDYVAGDIPAVAAYEWTYCKIVGLNFAAIDAAKSIGIQITADIHGSTAKTIYIDAINVYSENYGGLSWPLKIITDKVLDRIIPNQEFLTGFRPSVLAQGGGKDQAAGKMVSLFRKPDASYPIWFRYNAWPREFDNTNGQGNVCDISDIDDVLIAGTCWLMFSKERSWESANQWQGTFRRALAESVNNDEKQDGWEPVKSESFNLSFGDLVELPTNEQGTDRSTTTGFFFLDN